MNLMKFDRNRNSAELRELLNYLVCVVIGCAAAEMIGMSWVGASFIVLCAFRHWKKKEWAPSPRLRVLAILICVGVLLYDNWPSYCEGVSQGYAATARIGPEGRI